MAARKTAGNQWTEKAWRDAIRRAVMRAHENPKKGKRLDALADVLIEAGLDGDIQAIKEMGDRVDGRVPQALTGPEGGAVAVAVSWQPPSA